MKRLIDAFYRLLQFLLILLMGLLILPVCMQILSRFTGLVPRYIWTEEAARLCFIWIIMLGSMIAVRDGTHFDLEVLPQPKSPRGRALMSIVRHLMMMLVALTFVWFGYEFSLFGYSQESELTGLNMLFIHIAWPLAGVAYTLFLAEKLWKDAAILRGAANE
ncbi:MAG TPA: TRAP transporter small permease [Burkholderiales bacterium]|nr:TRAP transporter small permease [Burkholderiales bacterium]